MSINLKPWQIWSATGLVVIISRLLFSSNGVWHNDAADFIRVAQQWLLTGSYVPAHAPDSPLWNLLLTVWLWLKLKLFYSWSLITWANNLNLLLGTVASILTGYFLWLRQKNYWLAVGATLLIAFNPLFWLHQQTSLSDVPALLFTTFLLVVIQKYLNESHWKYLLLIVVTTFALITTRLAGGLTLLPIAIWLGYELYQQPKRLLLTLSALGLGAVTAGALYTTINHGLENVLGISRRVTPSMSEVYLTVTSWINDNNLLFILLAALGLYALMKSKDKLVWLITSALVVWLVYVAGWWREGSFDVTRYALPTSILIALAGAYGLKLIASKRYLSYGFVGLIIFGAIALLVNNSCSRPIYLINQKSYCQIAKFHSGIDAKQQLYTLTAPNLPSDAIMLVPAGDWSYPKLFLQFQNHNQRQMIYVDFNNVSNVMNQIKQQTENGTAVYILEQHLSNQQLADELESDHWQLEAIDLTREDRLIKIERAK